MASSLLVPPGARDLTVGALGGRWRVLAQAGLAPARTPALLIHGGGFDNASISWFHLIEALGAERPVLAPDLPGCGGTQGVALAGRADLVADQLAGLLDAMGIARVIVCGVSMGGEIALQFGLRHPERTEAVVAIAPGGLLGRFGGPVRNFGMWLLTRPPERGMDLISRASAPWIRRSIDRIVRNPLPAPVVEEFVAEAHRPGTGVAYGTYNRRSFGPFAMTNNLLPYLSGLDAPTLFFHGEDDPMVSIHGSEAAVALMPDARLVRVPHCGHWAQLEKPDEFLAAWRRFVGEHHRLG
ncbi:MAG: alpha/beta fold hydrolase [Propionibacteriaceae bacterium]|nr:alpha/beta fold hydrolase [Propionibacteriaceae bacterium]